MVWVEPDIRDWIVGEVQILHGKTELSLSQLIGWLGIRRSKYYDWAQHVGEPWHCSNSIPRQHWLLPEERRAILDYARSHPGQGYRRLTYMMLDENIVAVSPSSTYRILSEEGLLKRWNSKKTTKKGKGFHQPDAPHQHWHTDIKYVNFHGTFLFLMCVIDGYSRFIVHHELRTSMQEYDVQITLQRALEKYPGVHPRMITDNGPQYIAKDFAEFIRFKGLQHVRTSPAYPQSNGKIERFHATINQECLQRQSLINLEDARRQIASYIDYYNTKRLHSAIWYLTPEEVLNGKMTERLQERKEKLDVAAEHRKNLQRAA